MRLLLATDEPLLAEIIAFRLELLGYNVDINSSTGQVLRSLEDQEYAVVMIDTSLSGGTIRETLTKIRSRWSKANLPIMVISMDQSLELVEQVFRAGADEYLLAPFDPQAMQSKLDRLLGERVALQPC
jgi:DNA-binding response OmpR family regulator